MPEVELDALDKLASEVIAGYVVRKGLARRFKGRYPVPEYVAEFLLGRYCASTDEAEIAEGLGVVGLQMRERTVRPGEEELFKSRARERGTVKLIDLITVCLDTHNDCYLATLPSLRLSDVRVDEDVAGAFWYGRLRASNSRDTLAPRAGAEGGSGDTSFSGYRRRRPLR